jgi:septal ring factor EnvC (AmiA/AmiB activator)
MTIKQLKSEIAKLQKALDNFELDNDDYAEQYEQALDESGDVHIGSLTYSASQVLKEVDPTAYRCGLNDYVDSIDKEDDPKYQELVEKLEALQDELAIG